MNQEEENIWMDEEGMIEARAFVELASYIEKAVDSEMDNILCLQFYIIYMLYPCGLEFSFHSLCHIFLLKMVLVVLRNFVDCRYSKT